MPLFENNLSPYLTIVEATEPSAPSAGQQRLYIDSTTHLLKATNSSGTDRTIEGVPAGAITTSGLTQATARLLGRTTASTGAVEEITVGTGLSLSAGALTATGGGAGALTFLEGHTASNSATLDFTSFISSTYDDYLIEIVGLLPITDAQDLHMYVGTGGGPTYDTTGSHYSSVAVGYKNDGTLFGPTVQNPNVPILAYKPSNVVDYGGVQLTLRLRLPQSTTQRRNLTGHGQHVFNDGGLGVANIFMVGIQYITLGTALTALQFLFNSGNIASGTIRIYGLAKS